MVAGADLGEAAQQALPTGGQARLGDAGGAVLDEQDILGQHRQPFLPVAADFDPGVDILRVGPVAVEMHRRGQHLLHGLERFAHDVEKGVAIASDVGLRFGGIIEQVKSASDRFEQVGEGMRSQNQGARQIDEAMRSLTDGARHTAASVREFNAATEHLRDAVGGLRNEIAHFRVSE